MAQIPKDVIDQIIKGTDIVGLISNYVKLEKKGRNYFGLCPFHSEKTPSFSVSPEKQIFRCFSCGEAGNVINFLAKIESISYIESVKRLASKLNLNIEQYLGDNINVEYQKYYDLNKFVLDFYRFALLNTIEGKEALKYLENRKITQEEINYFKIGLAPDSVDSLYQALKANNFTELAMLELGVVTKSDNKFYDKFKNRIMFPITNELGYVVGFSGRIFKESDLKEAKYINTQETPIFKKSEILYNLDNAIRFIREKKRVYLFEGFMDVIASHRAGLHNAVASMGTALTPEQVNLMKKYTRNVVICFDGDSAGIEATKRAIDLFLKERLNPSIVTLPEGLDPDEYINKYGKDAYIDYLTKNEKSYREYLYELYHQDINISNIESIEQFKRKVFQLLLDATPTERELFLLKLSTDINVSIETLKFDYANYSGYIKQADKPTPYDVVNQQRMIRTIERSKPSEKKLLDTQKILIFFAFNHRKFVHIINNRNYITFKDKNFRRLYHDVKDYYQVYDEFDENVFRRRYVNSDEYNEFFTKVYQEYINTKIDYDVKYLEQCFAVITNDIIASMVQQLKEDLKKANDQNDVLKISQKIVDYYKIIKVKN